MENDGFDLIQTNNPSQLAYILRSSINLIRKELKDKFKFRVIPPDKLKITPKTPSIETIKKKVSIFSEGSDLYYIASTIMNESFEEAVFPTTSLSEEDITKLTALCSKMNFTVTNTSPLTIQRQ